MDIREIVLKKLAVIVAENSPIPFPNEIDDDDITTSSVHGSIFPLDDFD